MHFKSLSGMASLLSAHAKLDGLRFKDSKGAEARLTSELAPHQKVPRKKVIDKKEGTIEKDADFLAFVKRLEEVKETKIESAEVQLEKREAESRRAAEEDGDKDVGLVAHTPLMDYLREKRDR